MMAFLKRGMVDSAFANYSNLLRNIRSIQENLPIKKWVGLPMNWVYPSMKVKWLPPPHQFLHEASKFRITIEQNGDVSFIFENVKCKFWQQLSNSSRVWLEDLQLQVKNNNTFC